jgi:hypothetical protein
LDHPWSSVKKTPNPRQSRQGDQKGSDASARPIGERRVLFLYAEQDDGHAPISTPAVADYCRWAFRIALDCKKGEELNTLPLFQAAETNKAN